jgi:hypothetical protein
MAKPKLNSVVHIPLMKYDQHVQTLVTIPKVRLQKNSGARDVTYYDLAILDSHMFRGNDSSKKFYNQFLEEVIDDSLRSAFKCLDPKILDFIFIDQSPKKRVQALLAIPEKAWLQAYVQVIQNANQILKDLGSKNEYYLGYVVSGLYESAVMSAYQMDDYHSHDDKYFWYICW